MDKRKQVNVNFETNPRLYKKVEKLADDHGLDKSKLTRFALKKLVEKIETGEITSDELEDLKV